MNTYKKLTKEECADKLLSLRDPVIICHVRPDGDTVGTAKALSVVLRMLNKKPRIACADKIPERLKFILTGENLYQGSPDGLSEGDAVTVDIASLSQMGALCSLQPRVSLSIDHHAVSFPFADNYTNPDASSAAEALADALDVLENRGLITMTKELAEALYTAISSDTGCFCYANATAHTHLYAAKLLSCGIDSAKINHRLFHTKSRGQICAEGFIGSTVQIAEDGRIAYASVTDADIARLGLVKEDFETAIDVVRSLAGCKIAFVVKQSDGSAYKISLRSVGPDVAAVAARFGGGGHILAAGCTVAAKSADDAKEAILKELAKVL